MIGSYIHGMFDSDFDSGFGVQQTLNDDSDFTELRFLRRWTRLNLTGGAGYYTSANAASLTFQGLPFPTSTSTTRHVNGYGYATFNISSELAVIGGLSGDRFDSALIDRHQVNPKIGFSWSATPNATLRAASFRALRRTLVSSQTIEPTNIAGFNQFFADIDSTDYWRHGIGMDVKLGDRWFTGTEFSMRELEVPTVSVSTNSVTDIKRIEKNVTAYAYSYVTPLVSVLGEYTFEKANRDALGRNEGLLANATLHELAGEIRLFARNGLLGRFRATFVDEDGAFQNVRAIIVPGEDRFWVADASIGYRLPRQWGVLNLDARNLLDKAFRFQDSAPRESRIQPRRSIILRLTLAL